MSGVTTIDVPVGPYHIHLSRSGNPAQEAVLWLHGSGPGANALTNWEWVIGEFAGEFHNLAPDILGFGDSSHPDPPPQGIPDFTRLRVDTLLGLLDALAIPRVHLVGNSMGGLISLSLVTQAPERVGKIVLMGSAGAPIAPTPDLIRMITFYNEPTTEAMAELLTCFVYDPAFFGGDLQKVAADRLPRATREDVRRSHLATFAPVPPVLFSPEDLARITQPTLVVHGREDRIIPVESGHYMATHIPNAALHVLPKTGHWIQIEQPKRFANLVRAFLHGAI